MEKKYKIGYTTGVYDMFHIGHLNILRRAKEQCETLIVGVTTDELCYNRKQKYPIINEQERMAIVEAIRYVDKVVPQADMEKIRPVKELGSKRLCLSSQNPRKRHLHQVPLRDGSSPYLPVELLYLHSEWLQR